MSKRPIVPVSPLPESMLSGYLSFRDHRLPHERERLLEMAKNGQKPETMVIACCDSRVSPEVVFDCGPGEIFVVRNVANLVPPYAPDDQYHGTSAALEFAVQVLRVKHIVVMGHGRCGGVHAFARKDPIALSPGDFIGKWITLLSPAAEELGSQLENESVEDYAERLAFQSIRTSLDNLATFPCVSTLLGRGQLALHGAYFDVATGKLQALDPETDTFRSAS
jgi:carbonic anhydrase